jgi:hypothetical protein
MIQRRTDLDLAPEDVAVLEATQGWIAELQPAALLIGVPVIEPQ